MNILSTLKDATSSRHASLEYCLPLLDMHLSNDVYKKLLQKFFAFYAPLELRLLAQHGDAHHHFDYATRKKTPLLMQDLVALNVAPSALVAASRSTVLPDLSNLAQSWGCLYVIEGATLGGQIISRHLRAQLGLDVTTGAAFFNGYGAQTGTYWKSFCAALSDQAMRYGDTDQIVLGALQTFDTLHACLMLPPVALPVVISSLQRSGADTHHTAKSQ